MKSLTRSTRSTAVLVAFLVLAVEPFAYGAATRSWFWQHQYEAAPVAAALYLLVLGALVVGRYRWAWLLLAALYGAALLDWGFQSDRFAGKYLLGIPQTAVTLALLVSSPMRDRLRRPVHIRRKSRAPAGA